MDERDRRNLTELLSGVNAGRNGACDDLASAVYADLRAMAERRLVREFGHNQPGMTIQPTVLASDTFMKLIRQRQRYDSSGHFFAIASQEMRRVLLDYCRRRKAQKRGGGAVCVTLDPEQHAADDRNDVDFEALDEAMEKLASLDARKANVVKYRLLDEEASIIRDIRRVPFKVGGYSVSYRNGHASVRIAQESYKRLKAYLTDLAPRRSAEHMAEEFRMLHFEPYASVRRQLLNLLRAVNRARKQAGFEPVPVECLRLKRRIYRPFALRQR